MAVKLFVGGLSFSTSNERLREVFAATGQVESAAVVTDRDTGVPGSRTILVRIRQNLFNLGLVDIVIVNRIDDDLVVLDFIDNLARKAN